MYGRCQCNRWQRLNAEGGPSGNTAVVITGTSYDSTTKTDVLTAAVRILDDGLDHTIPDVFVTGRSLAPTDQTQKYATIRYTQD